MPELQNEDTPILNYLHDLFYDFTAQRKKISPEALAQKSAVPKPLSKDADIRIFGGAVRIVYDYLIPLFNIREIYAQNGTRLFYAAAAGQLVSSSDNSFASFKGFPKNTAALHFSAADLIAAGIAGNAGIGKGGSAGKIPAPSRSEAEKMDGEYTALAENFGFWASEALLYTDAGEIPLSFFKDKQYGFFHHSARNLSFGSAGVYALAENHSTAQEGNCLVIVNRSYDSTTEQVYINIKVVKEKENGTFAMTGFSSGIEYFNTHKAYFIQKLKETAQR